MLENKALVEIEVPAINKCFDVYVPLDCKMSSVLTLIAHTIQELTDGFFLSNSETVLCDYSSGKIYDLNKFTYELNINNGSKLLLI